MVSIKRLLKFSVSVSVSPSGTLMIIIYLSNLDHKSFMLYADLKKDTHMLDSDI